MVVDRFTFNGKDSIIYSGVNSAVFASQNKAKAHVFGWSGNASIKLTQQLKIEGVATYTIGKYTDQKGVQVPLDHIPPFYGKISINQSFKKGNASVYSLFNGWKKIKDYNPNGEDNQQPLM